MNLIHIESRPSKQTKGDFDFFVNCDNTKGGLQNAIEIIRKQSKFFQVLSRNVDAAKNDDDIGTFLSSYCQKIKLCKCKVLILSTSVFCSSSLVPT